MNAIFIIRFITIVGIVWTLGTLGYLYAGGTGLSPYIVFLGLLLISVGASQVRRVKQEREARLKKTVER